MLNACGIHHYLTPYKEGGNDSDIRADALEAEKVEETILWDEEEQQVVQGVQDKDHILRVFDHHRRAVVVGVQSKEKWETET